MKELKDSGIKQIPTQANYLKQLMFASTCENRIIRIKEFAAMISLSRSTIYDRLNPKSPRFDPTFPRPIKLGASAIGWHLVDVAAWISSLTSTN